jgi:hypothetical protein
MAVNEGEPKIREIIGERLKGAEALLSVVLVKIDERVEHSWIVPVESRFMTYLLVRE